MFEALGVAWWATAVVLAVGVVVLFWSYGLLGGQPARSTNVDARGPVWVGWAVVLGLPFCAGVGLGLSWVVMR